EGSFPLHAEESPRQAFAGQYLYYDIVTDEGDAASGGAEIYRMDLRDSRSRKEGGSLLAQGARREWMASSDGRYAVWVEARGSVLRCCDAQRDAVTELASGVGELYVAAGQEAFFFTKAQGELFRCNLRLGQRPERVASGVRGARFFGGEAQGRPQAMIYYLLPAGEAYDLYALAQEGGAVLVAQAPARALFDHYELGGNLYFLKRGDGITGGLAIDDPQRESDAAMRQPQKPPSSGVVTNWLADVLGANEAYRREKAAWDKKVERDKVRAAAREALEGLPESEVPLDCYVYDGASARLLARGVREDRIGLLRPFGRPAMLYEKQRAGEGSGGEVAVPLDDLVAAYRSGGVSAMREALYTLAGGGGESAGYALAMMAPAGPNEVPMGLGFGGNAGWKAAFLPGSETMFYQERDVEGGLYALYSYELTDYGLSERKVIDLGVDDVTVVPGGVYYRKREADAKGSALYYRALDGRSGRVMQNAEAFVPAGDVLLAFDGADALWRVRGMEAGKFDAGVRLEGLRSNGSQAYYLANWEAGAGELRLFDLNAKGKNAAAKVLDTGATAIRVVK
ncbi:MAG: hypothetical protein LBB75_10050, partial [Oscillospiraceae bacterium]|nr:hypothetical protein [Oscillospiraceae bacterium]